VAARRNFVDAAVTSISPEARFDAAYKAIMQSALAALMARLSARHQPPRSSHNCGARAILTIGLDAPRVTVLDTLRCKRNLTDYSGDDIDDSTAEHCIEAAEQLLKDVKAWLKLNRPELINGGCRGRYAS